MDESRKRLYTKGHSNLVLIHCVVAGYVPRAKLAIPDSSEVVEIFCQAQFARYYTYGIRQAETGGFLVGLSGDVEECQLIPW
jgi:hypothetical protein